MSCDLMVFDLSQAPKEQAEFLACYQQQTEWAEDQVCNDFTDFPNEKANFFRGGMKVRSKQMRGQCFDFFVW